MLWGMENIFGDIRIYYDNSMLGVTLNDAIYVPNLFALLYLLMLFFVRNN